MKPAWALLLLGLSQALHCAEPDHSIPSVEGMPDLPEPFILRDWKKVARDFDRLVFDESKKGEHLPIIWRDGSRKVNEIDGFGLVSYVGDSRQGPVSNQHEAITSLAAVLGATVAGIDKSNDRGTDWVAMLPLHFHQKDGIGLYLNQAGTRGDSFWYDLLPSLLFYQVYGHYPETKGFRRQFESTAQKWREVVLRLGGGPDKLPDFDHTGFDFIASKPVDRGWKEADAAAGIACLQYLAYQKTGKKEYLETADWCLSWLRERKENPFYESILPYGAYVSARSNAERKTTYPTAKLIDWVLAGDNPRKWGSLLEKIKSTETYGLIGSVYPDYEYAFAMNTFHAAGILAPIARYEERFATPLAKWILNLAVNSRYFYPNAWPSQQQTSYQWASKYDPDFCIPYEGLRKQGMTRNYPSKETSVKGKVLPGDGDTPDHDLIWVTDEKGRLDYLCQITFPEGIRNDLIMRIADEKNLKASVLEVLVSRSPEGPAGKALRFDASRPQLQRFTFKESGAWWVRVRVDGLPSGTRIELMDLTVETRLRNPPHVGGDPTVHGWGATDLGIYGGSYAGFLGGMIETTSVQGILSIDLLATDVLPPPAYPTRLLYNPYPQPKAVQLNLGPKAVDLYEQRKNKRLGKSVSGKFSIILPPKSSRTLVLCPVGGKFSKRNGQLFNQGVVIDYRFEGELP